MAGSLWFHKAVCNLKNSAEFCLASSSLNNPKSSVMLEGSHNQNGSIPAGCWGSSVWGRHVNTREDPQQLAVLDVEQAEEELKQHSDKAWKCLRCLTAHGFSLSLFTRLPDMDESALCSFWGLNSTMLLSC